jgi:hypothetical protein
MVVRHDRARGDARRLQSGMWSPPSDPAAGTWLIENLRSFESGYFDDCWDCAYWITPAPIPD